MKMPEWLFNQTAEIREQGINGRGEKYDKLISQTKCRLDPSSDQVKRPDGTVTVRRANAMFPLTTDIKGGQVVVCEGETYEVLTADPIPSLFGYSHKEAVLG